MEIRNQKYLFLYALILTFVVFNLGIFFGYLLESSRDSKINTLYLDSEMEILDQNIQRDMLDSANITPDSAICRDFAEQNIQFGDRIYQEALQIKKYEDANRITSNIIFEHKRFDLLRTLFWMNSIAIKNKCSSAYHNVVYLYKYNNPSVEQISQQNFISNLLSELKEKYGNKVILIPIAADNSISSINVLIDEYNITSLPTILIDEKAKITQINTMEDIEKYLN